VNIEDVFSFNLKPKEDFGAPLQEGDSHGRSVEGDFVAGTDEEYFGSDYYLTREDAVKHYPEDAGLEPGDGFLVGKAVKWMPKINGDALIEGLGEEAADEVGESSHQWLTGVTKPQMDDLESDLTHVFVQWMKRHGHMPHFFKVDEITDHTVPEPPATPDVNVFQRMLRDFGRRDNE
jgi:hypothetical protein